MSISNTLKQKSQQLQELARQARLILQLTWQASPRLVLVLGVCALLQALMPSLQLLLVKAVIDRITLDLHLAGISQTSFAALLPLAAWIALTILVIAAAQILQPFSSTLQSIAGDRLTGTFEERVIATVNRWQGLARFENPATADDLQRLQSGAGTAGLDMLLYGTEAAITTFTALGLALTLFHLHPFAPFLLLLASLPKITREWDYANQTASTLYEQTSDTRRLQYYREMMLALQPAKDVRLYQLGPFFRASYEAVLDRSVGVLERLQSRLAKRMVFFSFLTGLAIGAIYFYVVWQIVSGRATLGDLELYGGAAMLFVGDLLSLSLSFGLLPLTFGIYAPALSRVLEAPPDLPLSVMPLRPPHPIRQGIVFEQVHFTYPESAEPVLRGVSFSIKPGEGLALVGLNGSGKTTIVKLLLRMYDPTAGRILIDGIDLREYDLAALRQEIGVVFQDFLKYELTVQENIGLGQVDQLYDAQRALAAATKSGALPLIEALPQGWETLLGKRFGDRDLSEGQWQKIALARAFMRDGQLLVLDEPTAALDVQTEHDLFTRFRELAQGKMTLLISHRLSAVRSIDRILFLEQGRVSEEGSHEALMRRGGEYARLYTLQAAQYATDDTDNTNDTVALDNRGSTFHTEDTLPHFVIPPLFGRRLYAAPRGQFRRSQVVPSKADAEQALQERENA